MTENIVQEEVLKTEQSFQGKKININTATKEELMTLDGIGATMAMRILRKREELGSFKVIEQIAEVDGIGEKTFEGIKNFITTE